VTARPMDGMTVLDLTSNVAGLRAITVTAELDGHEVTTLRTPARYDGFEPPGDGHLPQLGEHTAELLGPQA